MGVWCSGNMHISKNQTGTTETSRQTHVYFLVILWASRYGNWEYLSVSELHKSSQSNLDKYVTLAQLCNEVPIVYNGMPQIHPQRCHSPSTITTLSNTPIARPTPHTTIEYPDLLSHFATIHFLARPTDGVGKKPAPRVGL